MAAGYQEMYTLKTKTEKKLRVLFPPKAQDKFCVFDREVIPLCQFLEAKNSSAYRMKSAEYILHIHDSDLNNISWLNEDVLFVKLHVYAVG